MRLMRKYQLQGLNVREDKIDMIYAVIDTNVFIAALLTKNTDSPTLRVYNAI